MTPRIYSHDDLTTLFYLTVVQQVTYACVFLAMLLIASVNAMPQAEKYAAIAAEEHTARDQTTRQEECNASSYDFTHQPHPLKALHLAVIVVFVGLFIVLVHHIEDNIKLKVDEHCDDDGDALKSHRVTLEERVSPENRLNWPFSDV